MGKWLGSEGRQGEILEGLERVKSRSEKQRKQKIHLIKEELIKKVS